MHSSHTAYQPQSSAFATAQVGLSPFPVSTTPLPDNTTQVGTIPYKDVLEIISGDGDSEAAGEPTTMEELRWLLEREKLDIARNLATQQQLKKL